MDSFIVYGKPQPKQRPRVRSGGWTYTPRETLLYEEKVIQAAREQQALPDEPVAYAPLKMIIWCFCPIPTSWSKKKQAEAKKGNIYPINRTNGDIDNLAKIIMDALNGIYYDDDSQIAQLVINKRYDEEPRVEVLIDEM